MNRRRPLIAAAICAVILLSILLSSAYIAHEAAYGHDCVGKDCPICRFIAQIEQVRRGLGTALAALALLFLSLAARLGPSIPAEAEVSALFTLVGRKIRLND